MDILTTQLSHLNVDRSHPFSSLLGSVSSRQMPKVVKLANRVFRDNHLEGDVFLCSEAPKNGNLGAKNLLSKTETSVQAKVVSEFQNPRSKKPACGYGPDLMDLM